MKKLIMFLSFLGMVSVGSVYADGPEGAKEDVNCAAINADERNAGDNKTATTQETQSKDTKVKQE